MDDKFTSDTNIKLLWELITSFNIDKESNQLTFDNTLDIVKSLQQPLIEKNKLFIQIFTNKLLEVNYENIEENDFQKRINNRNNKYNSPISNNSQILSNNIKKEIKNILKHK